MFSELTITSNFTFLTGGSHPEEYVVRAAEIGLPAIAIADDNSVAGIVRAHSEARRIARLFPLPNGEACPADTPAIPSRQTVPRLIPAARLLFVDAPPVTALPKTRTGWGNLCRLLSTGRLRANKGHCNLRLADLLDRPDDLELLLWPGEEPDSRESNAWEVHLDTLARRFAERMHLLVRPHYDGLDDRRFDSLAEAAARTGLPLVASAAPLMHCGDRRRIVDVLAAIRLGRRVDDLGRDAIPNAERRLRSEPEIRRLFRDHPDAVDRAGWLGQNLLFSLDELRYEYPRETEGDETAIQRLTRLARDGLRNRYPEGAPDRVHAQLVDELRIIAKLRYEPYFLTVHDIVAFARSRGILCQGRGSAANSVLCYALGITSVDPEVASMVFARFVSEARNEPPDIDVDFEHERREEVIQWIYGRYGRRHAGLCATVIHYRGKRATREVGRAMGLPGDVIAALSTQFGWLSSGTDIGKRELREVGLDPADRRLALTMELIHEIIGFPRHLSQHTGGFVITEGRLDELVPVENAAMDNRTVVCWDKDDIDALGILKVDVLSLGMLTCIRKAFGLIERHHGIPYTLATLPSEDPAAYDMLCRADTVGVFQVESRAQMNFLPRMLPRCFYDLVIEVAIIRPGPIQGDMVHPYIRRRKGRERIKIPPGALGDVLKRTLGVPLFQEQAMEIAVVGAGFTPDQADRLRRSLATFRRHGSVSDFRDPFLRGMRERGHDEDFARRCFAQIEGFGAYGFPESHAASFALLVYASAWLKCHHPGIFACALLNSQPMGFYAPAQIVGDARRHGVDVRPVCVNASDWDSTMEPNGHGGLALRLGFRQVKGIARKDAERLAAARGDGYRNVGDVRLRAGLRPPVLECLAEADAFAALGFSRRGAMWQAMATETREPLPLLPGNINDDAIDDSSAPLPSMTLGEEIVEDYVSTRLSLKAHPVALLRHILTPAPHGNKADRAR